jgi:glycosyltransferase involved in cell wall biosynthesis
MITLLATVLNEGDNIHHLMQSLTRQTRQPDEVLIIDGGSHDNTVDIITGYADRLPLRVIVEPGCNISEGRNRGIQEANGDILAVTDAGVRLTDTWLERITQPLLDDAGVQVVAGFFKADPQTTFEAAMGATVLPLADEIDPDTFLPSSRSLALRQSAAQNVNGYPEWLDYCEDLVFDMRLKATQPPFVFVPDAFVWFRPRSDMVSYIKQYYRYARGDGKADLWRKRHAIRYVTYFGLVPLIAWMGTAIQPFFWSFFLVGGIIYLYQPYRRLPAVMERAPSQSAGAWLMALLLIPLIRVMGDVAKMAGYPVGWRWRMQHQPPDWTEIAQG